MNIMVRTIEAIQTIYDGITYKSRTEARWAVFFKELSLNFKYEQEKIDFEDGVTYLPDFYIEEFDCYFEVKANNDRVVIEEAHKAQRLSKMNKKVLLAIGAPSPETPNILYLNETNNLEIEKVLEDPDYRGRIMEDRRDKEVYWFSSEQKNTGSYSVICALSKKNSSWTDHDRYPLIHNKVLLAYETAKNYNFGE